MFRRVNKSLLSLMMCFIMLITLFVPLQINTSFLNEAAYADGTIETTGENGRFIAYLFKDGNWIEVGRASFNEFLSEESIDLSAFLTNEESARIKLMKNGGGSAHLDFVSLGENAPIGANGNEEEVLKKLFSKDLDLIGIDEGGIELVFPVSRNNNVLLISGRIESKNISKEPFKFPSSNNFKEISQYSEFYTYKLDSQLNSLTIDGVIDEVFEMKPFFREHCTPSTGHPAGYTYGWVMNDDAYLYVTMDFTPDNTMDGEKDYGKVYVKTDSGVKEFKVSVPEAKWGKPGFVYTDKVGYQHKVYEFKIPLSELDVNNNEIDLAFSAYGTAALDYNFPGAAYNSESNEYLIVYVKNTENGYQVYGQRIDYEGNEIEPAFSISNYIYDDGWYYISNCRVTFDSNSEKYLVTWNKHDNIGAQVYGRYVGSSGELDDDKFMICEAPESDISIFDIAYNSKTGNHIVIWREYGELLAKEVYADGTMGPTLSNIQENELGNYRVNEYISVSCDEEGRYLVVWDSYNESGLHIYGRFIDEYELIVEEPINLSNNIFVITDDNDSAQYDPCVTYNSHEKEFLVVWAHENENYEYSNYSVSVYGRTVSNTEILGEEKLIIDGYNGDSDGFIGYGEPFVIYNPIQRAYLILTSERFYVFKDEDDKWPYVDDVDIFAQFFSPEVGLIGDRIPVGDSDSSEGNIIYPLAVCNTNIGNHLAVYIEYLYSKSNSVIKYCIIPEEVELQSTVEFSSPSYDVYEDNDVAEITVTRTGNLDTVVSVVYNTIQDGTATEGVDYIKTTGTLTFEPDDTEATFRVPIIDDNDIEGDEDLYLSLSEDEEGLELGELKNATLTIIDNDEYIPPTENTVEFSTSNYTVDEGNKDVAITVKLNYAEITPYLLTQSEEEQSVITVVYSTYDNTAKSGEDYYSTSGILTFENDETEKSFIVTIKDDSAYEGSETVDLTLSSPIGAILGSRYNATLSIKDNDSPPSSGGGGGSRPKPETPPPTEKLPDGSLIDRMKGHITLSEPTKITSVKDKIKLSYDEKLLDKNTDHSPRIYYWNAEKENWVALASYDDGKGKVTAINDGEYTGWFTVFGVIQPEFSDLDDYWGEEIINRMNGLGMIEGYKVVEDDSIRVALPENDVTWAEFTMFIARILNIDIDDHLLPDMSDNEARIILEPRFDDCDKIPAWVFNTVAIVEDAGIIPENKENFESSKPIDRINAAVMISRALKMIEDQEIADLEKFKDYEDIPEWAREEIAEGVIEGYPDKTFKPNDNLTRAEALTLLYRLFVSGLGW